MKCASALYASQNLENELRVNNTGLSKTKALHQSDSNHTTSDDDSRPALSCRASASGSLGPPLEAMHSEP
jgi:hypothetical protein